MTEHFWYTLLSIVHRIILMVRNDDPVTTTQLLEWSRTLAMRIEHDK